MNIKLQLVVLALSTALFGCVQTATKNEQNNSQSAVEQVAGETEDKFNVDSAVTAIDNYRAEIEASLGEPVAVETTEMRAKVRQKWQAIHYYTNDGQVVRIKTYPHDSVSFRTEEFYLMDGELLLAVIEDNGTGEKGKAKEAIDKMYYFHDGEPIRELKNAKEKEFSVRESDGEELLQEAREYLEAFNNR